ncbi:MAG: lysophospholipase [Tissierellales bacterium]|jgi:alpha-beta hydrolase superfamily lysophospholipase|nr:lysophospholipase [Tissierellales bacterium]
MSKGYGFKLKRENNRELDCICWTVENPRGILQISHGMAEHKKRYENFAKFLNSKGFSVYAHDHRGHGKSANEKLGFFAYESGWEKVRDDIYALTKEIKRREGNVPIFLFGHSMGSFLSRAYIQEYGAEIKGVILSGTAGKPGIKGVIGKKIAENNGKKYGVDTLSPKLNDMAFGNYNNRCKDNKTEFDWLSRDENEVQKYIEDPLCGFVCTNQFYADLLGGLINISKRREIKKIPKNLPIFLISGSMDPVGEYKKGVLQTYLSYSKCGIKDVRYKFYEGARHELINELNKNEVYEDIINWIEEHL